MSIRPDGGGGSGDTTAPSTPSNLSASSTTSSSTNLSWSGSSDSGGSGLAGYEILRNGSVIGTTTGTSYTVSGLSASTGYSFNVRAYDGAGNRSGNSGTVNVTTSSGGGSSSGSTIQAEAYSAQSGTVTAGTSDSGGGSHVGYIANGDWLQYNNVDLGSTKTQFNARVASGIGGGASGLIEVRLGSRTGTVIGSIALGELRAARSAWHTVPDERRVACRARTTASSASC